MNDIEFPVVNARALISEVLDVIDNYATGYAIVQNSSNQIVAVVTDGDIRRGLLGGLLLQTPISEVFNREFYSASIDTPRENIIKQLDSHTKFIPVLDEKRQLVNIYTRDYLPLQEEKSVEYRSRAPVRVSFGGGGSDVTHYFSKSPGAVINATISIFSYCSMRVRDDRKIRIFSDDLNSQLLADDLDAALSYGGEWGLIVSILGVVRPNYGFEMELYSDFDVGSGLGGSSTVAVAILGCFNERRLDKWSEHEIAEIAFQAERLRLGVAGGWQDQYAAVFGGFNLIELNATENVVNPLKVADRVITDLENNLVLCNTKLTHDSGSIHTKQKKMMESKSIAALVEQNVSLCYRCRNSLIKGDLKGFGENLDKAWKLKRSLSAAISTPRIDDIYEGAIEHGASGGKLLGAGGGGYLLFCVEPFSRSQLVKYLKGEGLSVVPFKFERNGLKSWKSRVE